MYKRATAREIGNLDESSNWLKNNIYIIKYIYLVQLITYKNKWEKVTDFNWIFLDSPSDKKIHKNKEQQ